MAKRVRARENEKLRQAELEADGFDPEFLLSRHRHNLRILPHEVKEARILPPGPLVHGPHFGRWHITLDDRSRLRLQFETCEDFEDYLTEKARNVFGPIERTAGSATSLAKIFALSAGAWLLFCLAQALMTTQIITLALFEAVALLGLVLVILQQRAGVILPFAAFATLLNLTAYPRPLAVVERAARWARL